MQTSNQPYMAKVANEPMETDWIALADDVAAVITLHADRHDRDGSFVAEGYAMLRETGLFRALVPTEFGGGGATVPDISMVIRRLAASCGSTALAFAMHSHLVAVATWRWRHQNAPTEGLLRRIATEDLILVSSGGSDWLPGGGTAEQVEGGFRIHARKAFSSGSPAGDLLMTSAVWNDPQQGPTVLHFAVPLRTENVRIEQTWDVLGMRSSGSNDVLLDGVFVPEAAISGRRPQGLWHPLFHIISMIAFPLIYSAYAGVAEGARDRAIALVRNRPVSDALLQRVGAMENALAATRLALADMVALAETGNPGADATSRAMIGRTLVGDSAIKAVECALEVAGGAGFYRAAGLERAFRDVQGARFHPLQREPQQTFAARMALGLPIDD